MKKTLLLLIIAITLTACGKNTADGCIFGVVMSDYWDEPLEGASVQLLLDDAVVRAVSTFDDGSYEFNNLKPSKHYSLRAEYTNHFAKRYKTVRIQSGDMIRMDICLRRKTPGVGTSHTEDVVD